jgi:hypothetical protein
MKLKSIETIFKTLNKNEVRYLVAGGLAVVAHGYVRFTADIDLILDMTVKNLKRAVKVFNTIGYLMILNNCTLSVGIVMTKYTEGEAKRVWEKGWEGHERAQKLRMARLPLVEKIIWLEQAQEMLLNASKKEKRIQGKKKRKQAHGAPASFLFTLFSMLFSNLE